MKQLEPRVLHKRGMVISDFMLQQRISVCFVDRKWGTTSALEGWDVERARISFSLISWRGEWGHSGASSPHGAGLAQLMSIITTCGGRFFLALCYLTTRLQGEMWCWLHAYDFHRRDNLDCWGNDRPMRVQNLCRTGFLLLFFFGSQRATTLRLNELQCNSSIQFGVVFWHTAISR